MATPNIVPNANNEGKIGKSGKQWTEVRGQSIYQNGKQVADLDSPVLTGTPTTPEPSASDNSLKVANTSWIRTLLTSWGVLSGATVSGNLIQSGGTNSLSDSGHSPATLLNRTNHTGSQPIATVTSLQSTIDLINADIATANTNISGSSLSTHTHLSAAITDADSALGTANVVVKRNSDGGVLGAVTSAGNTAIAIKGTAAGGTAVQGFLSGASAGNGVWGWNESALSGSSHTAAGFFYTGAAATARTLLIINDSSGSANDSWEIGVGTKNTWVTKAKADENGRPTYYNSWGLGTKVVPSEDSSATEQTISWPSDANGKVLLSSNGSGFESSSNADKLAFRNAINLGDSADFNFVNLTNSGAGYIQWTGSTGTTKLKPDNVNEGITFELPAGGSGTETLVDGDGRGITDAALFRTAIGAPGLSGSNSFIGANTFSTIVDINPASNQMMSLTGAGGNTVTLSANPTAARAIAFPDEGGTLAITPRTDGKTVVADLHGITTVGETIATGATTQAVRTYLDVDAARAADHYAHAYVATATATTISTISQWEIAKCTTFSSSLVNNFSITAPTRCQLTYASTGGERHFLVQASVSFNGNAAAGVGLAIGMNNGSSNHNIISGSDVYGQVTNSEKLNMSTTAIVTAYEQQTIEIMVNNDTAANLTLAKVVLTVIQLRE
jgi:hypothetical protein